MSAPQAVPSLLPLLAVLVSLAAVPLILLSSRRPVLREAWTLAAAAAKFGLVLALLPGALAGRTAAVDLFDVVPGVRLALRADPLGVLFALVASGLWVLTSLYSIGYTRGLKEHKQTRYFAFFAVCLSATVGIAFAANLVTFILFYEILTIATYPLVIHKETAEAVSAGRKYLAFTLSAGVLLIAAAAWSFLLVGDLDFKPGGIFSGLTLAGKTAVPLFLLFLGGVGVKSAIMPLHSWLPTAMVAPTPVSALLHAVAVVKAGVFGLVRVAAFVFGPDLLCRYGLDTILIVLAVTTILAGSLLALRQDNLKRRLAYSTVSHLSYIVLGTALVSGPALVGALLHLAFHATMKITLFFCAGAIYVNLHRENVSELNGTGKVMPWTMAAFALGSLGLCGVPPLNGFLSKWFLGSAAVGTGRPLLAGVLILSGLLNAAYLLPIVQRSFFRRGSGLEGRGEASAWLVAPLVLTAVLSLVLGLFPGTLFRLAGQVAAGLFGS
ncbi:MAG: cation:proton antiporter [Candidatus Aminicenantes bacterium RBG_13_63_10]|nr:MAG: cation:proton antiporter [Candidatus Aminicenantes bacterium RBG_13_63_10]